MTGAPFLLLEKCLWEDKFYSFTFLLRYDKLKEKNGNGF